LIAACALSIPATALTKASYRRLDVDEPENSSPVSFLRVDESAPYSILDNNYDVATPLASPAVDHRHRKNFASNENVNDDYHNGSPIA
jgi:hypothetical protein